MHCVLIPGNHDCDHSSHSQARGIVVKDLKEGPHESIDRSVELLCTGVQDTFFGFRQLFEEASDPASPLQLARAFLSTLSCTTYLQSFAEGARSPIAAATIRYRNCELVY